MNTLYSPSSSVVLNVLAYCVYSPDGTTGRSEESLGAHGDSELYESDSGVGSETPGAFGQTNKVKLSAPKLKRKHARASLVADKLNNSESKETVTPNGDASVVVNGDNLF